jgi:hypothetical protein
LVVDLALSIASIIIYKYRLVVVVVVDLVLVVIVVQRIAAIIFVFIFWQLASVFVEAEETKSSNAVFCNDFFGKKGII